MSTKVKAPIRLTRTEQRAANRAALIGAARAAVADGGYDAMQLEDVAARVRLTKGAVYSIFGSKLDLLVAVLEDLNASVQPLIDLISAYPLSVPVEDMIERSWEEMMRGVVLGDSLMLEADLMSLVVRNEKVRDRLRELNRNSYAMLDPAFIGHPTRSGHICTEDDSRHLSRMLVTLFRGMSVGTLVDGSPPDPELVRRTLLALVPQ